MTFYSNGLQQRDYVHVDDVVDLIERCLDKNNDRLPGAVMNVCTKTLTSVRDVIQCAEKAFETKLDYT
jgi:nucleoside-diphosphate-sugar epimerase